jgi:acetoin utilization protein AcuB
MFVRDVMNREPVTVTPETTLPEAVALASRRGIRHLPIVHEGRLIGIVSDRDLKRAMASPAISLETHELTYLLNRLQMREIMTTEVITTGPTMPVEEAARLMVERKIGALPVTEGGRVVGIVTESDVLALFVSLLGVGAPSSRLDVMLGARPAALADVTRIVAGLGASISSIVTLRAPDGTREAVIRLATIDPRAVVQALVKGGYQVRDTG